MLEAYADRWALITGASSGIGAEFAGKLAARGMHLVLIARRKQLMEQLAEELHTRHGTKSEIFAADLSEPGQARRAVDEINRRGIEVELLVNNAGFGFVGVIDDTEAEHMLKMIRLNISASTEITYLILPGMLERQHGAIINVSSQAAFQPVAYMPVYSASKAYMLHFSEALWAEARDRGVTIMALCPGTTNTEFFKVAGIGGWLKKHRAHSTEGVVKTAIKALDKKRQYIVPGWRNYLLTLSVRLARRKMVVLQSMKYFRPTPHKNQTDHEDESKKEESQQAV